jgi:hypothetical protein
MRWGFVETYPLIVGEKRNPLLALFLAQGIPVFQSLWVKQLNRIAHVEGGQITARTLQGNNLCGILTAVKVLISCERSPLMGLSQIKKVEQCLVTLRGCYSNCKHLVFVAAKILITSAAAAFEHLTQRISSGALRIRRWSSCYGWAFFHLSKHMRYSFFFTSVVRRPRWSWMATVSPRATFSVERRRLPAASVAMA